MRSAQKMCPTSSYLSATLHVSSHPHLQSLIVCSMPIRWKAWEIWSYVYERWMPPKVAVCHSQCQGQVDTTWESLWSGTALHACVSLVPRPPTERSMRVWERTCTYLCLPDITAHDQISQAFPHCIFMLQEIKHWRWEWPATSLGCMSSLY